MESSKTADLSSAWDAIEDGNDLNRALGLALPWAQEGDWEASTICALAYLYSGESDLCDEWTINAAALGARDSWLNQQSEFDDFAVLVCRLDALTALKSEGVNPLEANMALQRYLLNGSLEFALYYSIKAIRALWHSTPVNKDITNLANCLLPWIYTSNFSDSEMDSIFENLSVCTAGALSVREMQSLISTIEESLEE